MIEILRQYLMNRLGTDVDNLEIVLDSFKPIEVKRNEIILRQGDVCRNVYFVASGCLQVYVYDAEMNETTRDLVIENNWCSELISFGSGKPASENIRALEASQLIAIEGHLANPEKDIIGPGFDLVGNNDTLRTNCQLWYSSTPNR
jgi:CRP-like cAMP-binding protein